MEVKTCICCYASGGFLSGANNMIASFRDNGYEGDVYLADKLDPAWPQHPRTNHVYKAEDDTAPYAFKACILNDMRSQGFEILIWSDSCIRLIRPFSRLLELLEEDHYLFALNGYFLGEYTSDSCLKVLGVGREEVMGQKMLVGGGFVLDLRYEICEDFLRELYFWAIEKKAFQGSWTNRNQEVSADPRVKGHRHDQSVMSILAKKHGMDNFRANLAFYPTKERPEPFPNTLFSVGDLPKKEG